MQCSTHVKFSVKWAQNVTFYPHRQVREEKENVLLTEQDMHEVISTELIARRDSKLPLGGHSCAKSRFIFGGGFWINKTGEDEDGK